MERKDIYIELLDCFMRGELPAEQEHELRTWFKQPEVREMLFQHYRHSWTEAEGKAPEPTLSENIIKLQIIDNHILSTMQSKSKSF